MSSNSLPHTQCHKDGDGSVTISVRTEKLSANILSTDYLLTACIRIRYNAQ